MYGKAEVLEALQVIEQVYHETPDDPIIAAYYADCLSMTGKDAIDTTSVFGSAINAVKLFDEILDKHPESIEVRLLRVCQSYRLPEVFFRRTMTAIKDLEYVIEAYEQKKVAFSEDLYFKLLYLLGKAYGRMGLKGEAEAVWRKLLASGCSDVYRELVEKASMVGGDGTDFIQEAKNVDPKELFKKAKQLHELAMNGDENAAVKAAGILEKLYEAHPDVPIIEGYYGSSIALAGKNSSEAQELFGSAIRGMKHLNHAVDADHENPKLRYLRAYLSFNLPEAFFHLGEKACTDFNFVIRAYEKNHTILTEEQYCRMLYDLGNCCRRLGKETDAESTWNRLMQTYPDSQYVELIREFKERSVSG